MLVKTAAITAILLLSACGPLIDVKFVKNPTPREAPGAKPGPEEPTLHEISQKETESGTKVFALNADIDPAFASEIGLGTDACIQVVELSDGLVVVDFGNVACPTSGLIQKDEIVFTLRYVEPENPITDPFLIVLGSDENVLGHARATSATSVMLNALCNGEFAAKCVLTIESGKFKAFKEN